MLKPGIWVPSLPCQVFPALQVSLSVSVEPEMLFKHSLALLGAIGMLHSVEIEESSGPWALLLCATVPLPCSHAGNMEPALECRLLAPWEGHAKGSCFLSKWHGIKLSYLHWKKKKIQLQLKSVLQVQLSPCRSGPGPGPVIPAVIHTCMALW